LLLAAMDKHQAILLIGPTGSGKTPLGVMLAERGLAGRQCRHFDFGRHLRTVESGELAVESLTSPERAVISDSLRTGALLTDEQFPIASKLLVTFLREPDITPDDLVVLNGLPRHVGQARSLQSLLEVSLVVYLSCGADVIWARIATNVGGDRAGREDDNIESVRNRLGIFERNADSLIDFYRDKVNVITMKIAADTSARQAWQSLNLHYENLLQRKQ